MVEFKHCNNGMTIVTCEDGQVYIDKRVFEQKLGTLVSCKGRKEVYEVAVTASNYLKEHYGTDDIKTPLLR